MFEVGEAAREKIVRSHHRVAFAEQSITKMRTEKPAPRDQRAAEFIYSREFSSREDECNRPALNKFVLVLRGTTIRTSNALYATTEGES